MSEKEVTQAKTKDSVKDAAKSSAFPNPLKMKRKLTPFLCEELLYEYATNTIDPQRRADIEKFLPTDKKCQEALEAIRRGLEYSNRLATSEISPELMARLSEAENLLSLARKYCDWYEWPEMLRWSTTAIAVSLIISGLVTIVPWSKLPSFPKSQDSNTVVLTDIPGVAVATQDDESSEGPESHEHGGAADSGIETSGDEHITGEEPAADLPPVRAQVKPTPLPAVVSANESPTRGDVAAKTSPKVPDTTPAMAAAAPAASAVGTSESKPKGFVYRAFMNVANVDETTPDVTEQLESFGGEKAGEVPLGWRKGAGSYFHFTVPQSNEEQVLEMLRAYGPVRISKDPHPRVMPTGQVRFILWIEPQAGSQ